MSTNDDWRAAWQPMMERVGHDFSDGEVRWGADAIEPGTIRRYLEPLEFDCPLFYDREIAQAHGLADIAAPWTSLSTFSLPAQWVPGQPLFTTPERNAQPAYSPLRGTRIDLMPPTTAYFATDFESEYLQMPVVGDRVGRRGNRLVSCEPKETQVGRGAFTGWEYEFVDQHLCVLARIRFGMYYYNTIET